jgi:hypothetical protein
MSDEEPTGLLTDEQLDELAFHLPHIKAWVAAVERELLRAIENGVEFRNVYLEPKRANRKWIEFIPRPEGSLDQPKPFDVIKLLRKFSKLDVVAPRVPLSPSQAEKTLGRSVYSERCSEFVVKESSGMKLAYTHPEENAE